MLTLSSCSFIDRYFSKKDPVLARANGKTLKRSEALTYLPHFIGEADSAKKMKVLIKDWVNKQLFLEQASDYEGIDDEYIVQKMERFRENILLNEYIEKYAAQRLDTLIAEKELEIYWQKHQNNFLLDEKIVKGFYIKIDKTSPLLALLRKEFNKSEVDIEEFKKMAQSQGKEFVFSDSKWIELSKLIKEINPLQQVNQRQYLIENLKNVVETKEYVYFVKILELAKNNEIAPFELKKELIRHLIITDRKQNLVQKLKDSIQDNADKKKSYEIY